MKLRLYLADQEISVTELQPGKEYVAGRSSTAHIVLDHPKGISREHLKFSFVNGQWQVTLTARYGRLLHNEKEITELALTPGLRFSSPPFTFEVEGAPLEASLPSQSQSQRSHNSTPDSDRTDAIPIPAATDQPQSGLQFAKLGNEDQSDGSENTNTGLSHLTAQLKAVYSTGEKETFTLEGNAWLAGRVPDCEIYLRDHHISRHHFEIIARDNHYYLEDLGSSNGTRINGRKLKPNHPVEINSGDLIEIMSVKIVFEIRDEDFQNKLVHIPDQNLALPVPISDNALMALPPPGYGAPAVGVEKLEQSRVTSIKNMLFANKIRSAITVIVGLVFINYLFSDGTKQTDSASKQEKKNQMTEDQRRSLENSIKLAKSHFAKGNFANCISEIEKIEMQIPIYQDSQRIKVFCQTGLENLRDLEEKKRLEQQRLDAERTVREVAAECGEKIASFEVKSKAEECLARAIELNPSDAEVVRIIQEVEQKEMARKAEAEKMAADANYRANCVSAYNEANRSFKSKPSYREKIEVMRKFLGRSCPDINSIGSNARRMLASAESGRQRLLNTSMKSIKSFNASGDFRQAAINCSKVEKEETTLTGEIAEVCSGSRKNLNDKLRAAYENANIEESYNNLDEAIDRWKKLCVDDVPGGDYCKKARIKLKLYGK